jgi:transcriptional regulator with XRE-family HTH domain
LVEQDAFYRELGERIRVTRRARQLPQARLAELVGLKRTSITNIERGKQKLLAHTLFDIALVLGVEPGALFPSAAPSTEGRKSEPQLPDDLSPVEREWIRSVLAEPGSGG